MLSWSHANLHGDWAVSNGWLARAESVLEAADLDCVERGWVEILRARGTYPINAQSEADAQQQWDCTRSAISIARRFGDVDLEFEALGWLGLMHVFAGRVDEGMPLIDEALAAVCSGEVQDLFVIEGVFCGMFWASGRACDGDAPVAYGPRRTVLDKMLVDAASEAGAEVRVGFSVEEVVVDGGRVSGIRGRGGDGRTVTEHARVVVGERWTRSPVSTRACSHPRSSSPRRTPGASCRTLTRRVVAVTVNAWASESGAARQCRRLRRWSPCWPPPAWRRRSRSPGNGLTQTIACADQNVALAGQP